MRTAVIWLVLAVLYLAFFTWYTGSGKPLTAAEIDAYLAVLAERNGEPERLAGFRSFLESDDGGDFVIVNAILLHDEPEQTGAVKPGETSQEVLGRYMEFMWPALLSRASHPVIGGEALHTVETWGVEGGEQWSTAGLIRYRSRRDLMEIATDPAFADAHQYKVAAMEKTIAFAIDPFLNLGEPRVLLALLLIVLGALGQRVTGRRRDR